MYLTQNKIKDIPPNTISSFTGLKLLELGANKLRTLEVSTTVDEDEGEEDGGENNTNDSSKAGVNGTGLELQQLATAGGSNDPNSSALLGLVNLEELWLGKNKITSMFLPNLPNLKKVAFHANRLTEWNTQFFKNCPNITHLYCSENNLPNFSVPETFAHTEKLVELDLSCNIIQRIPSDMHILRNLKEFWINKNKIDFDDENAESIAGLWKLRLTTLYMEHNPCWDGNFTDGGAKYTSILKKACGDSLEQLDATVFEFERAKEQDLYGTLYKDRDNTVKGIRKFPKPDKEKEGES